MGCGNHDLICKIAKQIVCDQNNVNRRGECIGCDTSLSDSRNNTKPVSFFMEDGSPLETFFSVSPSAGVEMLRARFYRIEEVLDDCYAKCRLIGFRNGGRVVSSLEEVDACERENYEPFCTDQTCILNLDCVCCLQCFEPIFCQRCGRR